VRGELHIPAASPSGKELWIGPMSRLDMENERKINNYAMN
jgi:hypothetical protein